MNHPAPDTGGESSHEVDEELTRLLQSGCPLVLRSCRHTRQVTREGGLFLVSDDDGNIQPGCRCGMGLYLGDTRFLSGLVMTVQGALPTLLSHSTETNRRSEVEWMNPRLSLADGRELPQETLYGRTIRELGEGVSERVRLVNYHSDDVDLTVEVDFQADFADIFEVRGMTCGRAGTFLQTRRTEDGVVFAYRGADDILRETRLHFEQAPHQVRMERLGAAAARATIVFRVTVGGRGADTVLGWRVAPLAVGRDTARPAAGLPICGGGIGAIPPATLHTSHEVMNLVLDRCRRDLASLTTVYESGPIAVAGLPWYAAPFGRDSLLTAMQTLWLGPDLARGTLRYLAQRQAKAEDPFRDAEPGKIMHEVRGGELANLGRIPHTPYYGSIDSTPLFLILLSETFRWTGDTDLLDEFWDAAELALMWLEGYGDRDGDGFVEYRTASPMGLAAQGWKDSHDSVPHEDGRLATPPIALVEVQGYAWDARMRLAELCVLRDQRLLAERLLRDAATLARQFDQRFWCPSKGTYALALDGDKRQVTPRTSNPGHALWSGIVPARRMQTLVRSLMGPAMHSGWGIRTLAADSPVYNPLSYHNGSVWPHDNAIIAAGLAQSGFKAEAMRILEGLFEAAQHFPYYRLPELFCGFARQGDMSTPVPYPVACAPQAWAAGALYMVLQAVLGIQADAPAGLLRIREPLLPSWLEQVSIQGLRVGKATLDLQFQRQGEGTVARVLRKRGTVRVLIEG
ncbi:MAG: amylo-alpha-1,6-glucosidase [Candidatus Sericytochromatia bacterium]|nr:amylo-alpha-1,6-glucosidase [Candidatus Sericytochromatia bacterium]